ncbi:MAG TPA: SDR family NAD(P)-dependent oxidoreductase, partial [Stellaceae bacterium]|nr:SDR family NAD(P)-dependent oxidoreductase [Stellaceae bacterium]
MSASLDLADPLGAFRLDGEVAAVTGGASGIGAAIATALARVGARVALLDLDRDGAETMAGRIGDSAAAWPLDVADAAAVARAFDQIAARWGRIDVLVNSAGIA